MAVNPPDEGKKGRAKRQNRKWIPRRLVLILQVWNAADVSLWIFHQFETWLLNTKSERPFSSWRKFDYSLTHHVWPQLFSCSDGHHLPIRFRESFKQSFFIQAICVWTLCRNAEWRVVLMLLLSRPVETCRQIAAAELLLWPTSPERRL